MPRASTDTTAEAPSLALQLAPADMVDTARFDAPRKQQVAVIAASVSVADSNTVATFGAGPQRKLSGFLDQLLTGARADEIGVAGALVTGSFGWLWLGEKIHVSVAWHLAAMVVGVIALDGGTQMMQVANQTRIFGLDPGARRPVKTRYMTN